MEKVSGKTVLETVAALKALDGFEKDKERVIYKFSGLTLYSLAKNLRRLSEIDDELQRTRESLIRKHRLNQKNPKGELLPQNPADVESFIDEWKTVLAEEREVVISKFRLKDFDLENNRIPVTVVSALSWMVKDDDAEKATS